jgi:hypothetical protein
VGPNYLADEVMRVAVDEAKHRQNKKVMQFGDCLEIYPLISISDPNTIAWIPKYSRIVADFR